MSTCWTRFGPRCMEDNALQGDIFAIVSLAVVADNSKYLIQQHEQALKAEKFNNTLKVIRGITGIFGGGGLGGLFGG